ncbi:hypothetical protein F4825DRAFT_474692 [Nemania diffusa]|nr:hypothetical protein F4825DRAFT_474692 [Nemania diffusa]
MSGQEWRQTRSLSSRNLVFTRCVEPLYSTPPDLAYSTAQALSAFHFWERAGPQIRCCPVHGFPSSGLKYVEVRCDGSTSLETSSLVDAKIPRLREALCESQGSLALVKVRGFRIRQDMTRQTDLGGWDPRLCAGEDVHAIADADNENEPALQGWGWGVESRVLALVGASRLPCYDGGVLDNIQHGISEGRSLDSASRELVVTSSQHPGGSPQPLVLSFCRK